MWMDFQWAASWDCLTADNSASQWVDTWDFHSVVGSGYWWAESWVAATAECWDSLWAALTDAYWADNSACSKVGLSVMM